MRCGRLRTNSGRLTAALAFSLGLHGALLAWLPQGLPRLGASIAASTPLSRLAVSFAVAAAPAVAGSASAADLAMFHDLHDAAAAAEPAATEEAKAGTGVVENARPGLPWAEEMGPPYPPPAPTYWPAAMLDRPPQPLTDLDTHFAQLEGKAGAGRMLFSLLVSEQGKVDAVLNEYSSLGPEFVAVVQAALAEMRLQPGMQAGKPVKSRARIEVNFSYSVH